MSAPTQSVELARLAAGAAGKVRAQNVEAIDVTDRLPLTDVFVIASGNSERQVGAIVDSVEEQLLLAGFKTERREGQGSDRWILLDYGEIIVHVQHVEDRAFYQLEKLWADCPTIDVSDVVGEEEMVGGAQA